MTYANACHIASRCHQPNLYYENVVREAWDVLMAHRANVSCLADSDADPFLALIEARWERQRLGYQPADPDEFDEAEALRAF